MSDTEYPPCSCGWPEKDCAEGHDHVSECNRYAANGKYENVRETDNGFAYRRDGLWKHGDEYAELGKVIHWGGVPCVVTGWDADWIDFAVPVGRVMDVTGGRSV